MKNKAVALTAIIILSAVCSLALFACAQKHVHSYADTLFKPTCTEGGYTLHVCDCGDSYTDSFTEKTAHTPARDEAVPASCTSFGLTEGSHCGECGAIIEEQEVVPMTEHTPVTDAPAIEATCLSVGFTESSHCGECGKTLSERAETAMLPHSYESDVCISCSNYRPTPELTYTLNSDGKTYTLTGAENVSESVVHVAAVYEGKRVVAIGDRVFLNRASITKITLPEGIKTIGEFAFGGCTALSDLLLPSTLETIDSRAFSYCRSLESVSIPKSVTQIGTNIFRGCLSLHTIETNGNPVYCVKSGCLIETNSKTVISGTSASVIPSDGSVTVIGESAFQGCELLTEIEIPSFVTQIRKGAFEWCLALEKVTLPTSITQIEDAVFYNCASLESIVLPASLTAIGKSAFQYCGSLKSIIIPESVRSVGEGAFHRCASLKELVIPDGVTSIGADALSACTSLQSLTIPFVGSHAANYASTNTLFGYIFGTTNYVGTVAARQTYSTYLSSTYYIPESLKKVVVTGGKILYGSFQNCAPLQSVDIPDVDEIGHYAFGGCTGLLSFDVPSSVKTIGMSAFGGCFALESLTLPDGLQKTEKTAFFGCSALETAYIPISAADVIPIGSLKELHITSGGEIPDSAFASCRALENVYLADSIAAIGAYAFRYCSNLKSITLPSALTEIKSYTFEGCSSLTDIEIKSGITSIGNCAFKNCASLDVNVHDGVLFLGNYAFDGTAYENNPARWTNGMLYVGRHLVKTDLSQNAECVIKDGTLTVTADAFAQSPLACVTIPKSVVKIDYNAFKSCGSLNRTDYLGSVADWCEIEFASAASNPLFFASDFYVGGVLLSELVLPDGVTLIGDYAFVKRGFSEAVLPDSVQSIGVGAFEGCALTKLVCGGAVQIGNYAFDGCTSLKEIVFGSALKKVGMCAFRNCSSLTAASLPSGAEEIGYAAFGGCGALESIALPFVGSKADAEESSQSTLFGYIFGTSSYEGGIAITQYCSTKDYYVFYLPEGLTKVTVTGGKLLYGAFYNCHILTSVTIAGSVDYIGAAAFHHCFNLERADIGKNVTFIGRDAFYLCDRLKNAVINGAGVWTRYEYANSSSGVVTNMSSPTEAAKLLTSTYRTWVWRRTV